jgi:hypothetical protein
VSVSAADRAVLDKIDEAALVELTRSLLRATGQNPPGEEAATVAALGAAAAELGLDVCETTVRPGRNNLRITLAGGPVPACCCSAIPMWFRSARAGRRTRSAVPSRTAVSTAAAPPI